MLVAAHVSQYIQQRRLELRRVIHSEITVGIMDNAIRRTFAIRLLDQQAVSRQLEDVRIVGCLWRTPGLDLHWDDLAVLLEQVIRLAGKLQKTVVERLFDHPPSVRICIDDASAGKAGSFALARGEPEEDEGEKEKGKSKVEHDNSLCPVGRLECSNVRTF